MRIVFDPTEAEGLRASARDAALEDPTLAYVLLDLADRGVDLNECRTWEDIRVERGLVQTADEQRVA
ncbi:hypothetical protein GCM10010193_67460 [Kitasatospora atroaurantiaca]|uniref:Uncharacterized protein n=1 Tax=Kitasatospora atroaurantiaca TaxID=285545 RepID=A0A561EHW2_9ACTN|nr:hypothetical protein [Kitasatospora atroaurantiaca]TWE15207.1 hypothetical protein FB465_0086 [Kitasatospora atroaurantiaca]